METKINGLVIKGVGGRFTVQTADEIIVCPAKGSFRRDNDVILVGDKVELTKDHDWLITRVYPRKNSLVRPPVANIDLLVLVLAPEPEPDYTLLDKLLLVCFKNNIEMIVCVNKSDLNNSVYEYVQSVYGEFVKVYQVSAKNGDGLDELTSQFKGTVCFAGQSAVGKTSLLNTLCSTDEQTGELSKILRGRNTTRHVQIYKVNDECNLIDTCGFSMFQAGLPAKEEVSLYYPDFVKQGQCKFRTCLHVTEPGCCIREAVKQHKIDLERYYRYLGIIGVQRKWNK